MTRRLTRRGWLTTAAAAAGGVGAVGLAGRFGLIPPDYHGLYGAGETLTYATQRLLTSGRSRAREFARSDISPVAPVNGPAPTGGDYARLRDGGFADWRLQVDGLIERPTALSLDDLTRLPAHSQITMQACEEGWSFIAEWTGAQLAAVLDSVGVAPRARYVFFFTLDGWFDSLDMADALHPQTLLAYGMNGRDLPLDHGAPARLKVPRQLGYKNLKYLARMTVTDTVDGIGRGLGSGAAEAGYSWYAGI